jgi:hypothetical protein
LNDIAEELEKRVELAREYTYDSRMKKMMAIVED